MTIGEPGPRRYRSAEALWSAVTDRLRAAANADPSGTTMSRMQRQFVYSRLLARVFSVGDDDWVLKGGTALLARLRSARHSQDVDLFYRSGSVENAVSELRTAAELDLDDFFRFEITLRQTRPNHGRQRHVSLAGVHVDAFVGVKRVERFPIDLVVGSVVTADLERRHPAELVRIDGIANPEYVLYPMADHIADKVCATVEVHPPNRRPSSRDRDLVDLVVIAATQIVYAHELGIAIEAERLNRGLPKILTYETPAGWRTTYSRLARGVAGCRGYQNYDQAVGLVRTFLDPVLSGARKTGTWQPDRHRWEG